jgi:hypothetical protein
MPCSDSKKDIFRKTLPGKRINIDSSYRGKQDGTIEYIKKYQNSTITLIVKPNERRELLVLSAWIDPPLPGTQDAKKRDQYQEYRKATGWKKIWLIIKQQLGF